MKKPEMLVIVGGGGGLCKSILRYFWLKTANRKKYSAFSIAEAMITLLIVSVALAAAAPLMSRSVKTEIKMVDYSVPKGAIMFFDRNIYGYPNRGCPSGWTNISDGNSERFFMLNTLDKIGNTENAYLPNHWHGIGYLKDNADGSSSVQFIPKPFIHGDGYDSRGYDFLFKSVKKFGSDNYLDTKNNVIGFGLGTTEGLYIHRNSWAEDKKKPQNNIDGVKPKSISVIACRKD